MRGDEGEGVHARQDRPAGVEFQRHHRREVRPHPLHRRHAFEPDAELLVVVVVAERQPFAREDFGGAVEDVDGELPVGLVLRAALEPRGVKTLCPRLAAEADGVVDLRLGEGIRIELQRDKFQPRLAHGLAERLRLQTEEVARLHALEAHCANRGERPPYILRAHAAYSVQLHAEAEVFLAQRRRDAKAVRAAPRLRVSA